MALQCEGALEVPEFVVTTPENAVYAAWGLWLVSWLVAAAWANSTVKRAGIGRETLYRVVQLAGFVGLFAFRRGPGETDGALVSFLYRPLWTLPDGAGWLMVGLAVAGFAFCWWARLHLGRLWSGTITRKEGHHVVDSGPYGLVRHPIYTGIFVAAIATAAIKATPLAVVGAALIILALWMKARVEEQFLAEELGREAYDSYRRRVPMLVPFVPAG